jgi:tetratricopeptide (TPR) repeat protein
MVKLYIIGLPSGKQIGSAAAQEGKALIEPIEQKLSGMATARLVKIVLAALDTMGETELINFIAKHIDARASLARLGEDDPETFLGEVEAFCLACLNGEYYSDEDDVEEYFSSNDYHSSYYDDDWDYGEYYRNTEWAETFSKLFRLSVMYIRSGDISTGYEATTRLISCLSEAMANDLVFGTDEPDGYIEVDWPELFSLYYDAMFQHHTDMEHATKIAFRYWIRFGERCTEGFLANVKDIDIAESYVLDGLKNADEWGVQCLCFDLLEQLYSRLGRDFDKASKAKDLLEVNDYFHRQVVEGFFEQGNWQATVETANYALTKIPAPHTDAADWRKIIVQQKVRAAIQTKLADAYEKLAEYERAFETLGQMFKETPDYELYIRARALAEKTVGVSVFLKKIEAQFSKNPREDVFYGRRNLLLNIYSYEGEVRKMLDIVQSQKIGSNYYDRKYTALSLICRAIDDADGIGSSILEYLTTASGQDGIMVMMKQSLSIEDRAEMLLSGVDLLKGITAFHIDAATRSRYAKAAYYMCVMRDIYMYLNREDEFRGYFRDIITQNSRRPALRDEMSIVYGRQATMLKK